MSPSPRFDHVVHAPNRLQICSMLSALDEIEFAVMRDALGVSDSVLSKHLRILDEAGYVTTRKSTLGGRLRTWAALTGDGRRAFAGHIAELQRLAEGVLPGNTREPLP